MKWLYQDDDEWMPGEDLPEMDLFLAQIWLNFYVNEMGKTCGISYKKNLGIFRGLGMRSYYGQTDSENVAVFLVKKIVADPSFGESINRNIFLLSDELVASTELWFRQNLSEKSNAELAGIIRDHIAVHTQLYGWGGLSNATDLYSPEFTDYLKRYLRGKSRSEDDASRHFIALSTPDSFSKAALEQLAFLKLAIGIENDPSQRDLFSEDAASIMQKIKPSVASMIERHWREYKCIPALFNQFQPGMDYYYSHLKEFFASGKNASEEFERMHSELESKVRTKKELMARLGIDAKHERLFEIYANFMISKSYRRYAQIISLQRIDSVLEEIGRRLNLSRVEVRNTLAPDLYKMLETGVVDYELAAERARYNVLYAETGFQKQFVGEEAKEIEKMVEKVKVDAGLKELKGQVACMGKVSGVVKIVHTPQDAAKFNAGDVLVAISTNPDIVPLMKKASAIVTEQGGVTSHAAIVSRELGVPCVIGTKIATKWLKDGDIVEVDATRGIVRKLSS